MAHLTPTQQKIIDLLPATPDQLAQALYGRATESERNLIYVHIALLRRRLSAKCPTGTPQAKPNCPEHDRKDRTAHIVSRSISSQRNPAAGENACPEQRPESVEGLSRRDGLETGTYASRIIYELQN